MLKKIILIIFISSFVFANERPYSIQKDDQGRIYLKKSKNFDILQKNKNQEQFFKKNKIKNSEQNSLFRTHDENNSEVVGYWYERDRSERTYELLLDVYDSQEIPHPGQILALDKSSGVINVDAGASGTFNIKYLAGLNQWASTTGYYIDENTYFPFIDIYFISDTSDSYVFRPDSIAMVIYTEEAWNDTTGEVQPVISKASGKNVLINGGDLLQNDDYYDDSDTTMEFSSHDMFDRRIIHGITFEDTVNFYIPDSSYILAGQNLKVTGSLVHEKVTLTPNNPIDVVSFFDAFTEGGDMFVDMFLYEGYQNDDLEFFSNGIGNQYNSYFNDYNEIIGYDENDEPIYEYNSSIETDTIPFYYTDYGNYLDIRQSQTDYYWDENLNEEIEYIYEETFRVGYQIIEDNVVQWGITDEFCYDQYNESYSPYQCGDLISQFLPVYGLDGVSSLLLNESRTYKKDIEMETVYDYNQNGFSSIFPAHGTTINIDETNAWSDTLKFIWESADHLMGDVTYYPEVTGDLSKFFVLTGSTKETSWKFPYNQIKTNMSNAGINYAEGAWSIKAVGYAEVMDSVYHWDKIKDESVTFVTKNNDINFEGNADYALEIGYVDVHPNSFASIIFHYLDGENIEIKFNGNGNINWIGSAPDTVNYSVYTRNSGQNQTGDPSDWDRNYMFIESYKDGLNGITIKDDDYAEWAGLLEVTIYEEVVITKAIEQINDPVKLIIDATSLDIADNSAIPTEFKLHENYPNPFNPSTNIKFDIPENGLVSLIVYDLMGHKVTELVNTNMNSGFHNVSWNGTDNFGNTVSTGVYIYQLKTGNYSNTQKMLFIK